MGNTTATAKDATGATKTFSGVTDAGNSSAIVTKHLPVDSDGTVLFTEAAASADAVANPTLGSIQGLAKVYNGSTWDRLRSAAGTTGVLAVNGEGTKDTYATGAAGITPAATPSVIIEIKGSATRTVRIKKLVFQAVASTAKQWAVTLYRAAAAVTDGTPVTPVITEFDTSGAAATAVISHFTANPTPAAANPASSVVFVRDVTFTAPASAAEPYIIDFCQRQDKPFILRGAADCLCLTLGGSALTAGEKYSYSVEWEEDAS